MSYPSNRPEHVRTLMQNTHDRYAQGIDLFPKFRLAVDPEDLPRRSRHAAGLLVKAWDRIDNDRAYFAETLDMINAVGSGLTIVRVGKNAVNMGYLDPNETETQTRVMFVGQFEEHYGDVEFVIGDGRTTSYEDGNLRQHGTDFNIVRASNTSQIMLTEEGMARLAAAS